MIIRGNSPKSGETEIFLCSLRNPAEGLCSKLRNKRLIVAGEDAIIHHWAEKECDLF